jgi:hypothetical protein
MNSCKTPNDTAANTDRQLWRESNHPFSNRIWVTEQGAIGMDVGGLCIVMPIRQWHSLAAATMPTARIQRLDYCI